MNIPNHIKEAFQRGDSVRVGGEFVTTAERYTELMSSQSSQEADAKSDSSPPANDQSEIITGLQEQIKNLKAGDKGKLKTDLEEAVKLSEGLQEQIKTLTASKDSEIAEIRDASEKVVTALGAFLPKDADEINALADDQYEALCTLYGLETEGVDDETQVTNLLEAITKAEE